MTEKSFWVVSSCNGGQRGYEGQQGNGLFYGSTGAWPDQWDVIEHKS